MTAEEVITNFSVERTFLLQRYRFATEQALARAGFLHTSEIVTVQAFVLFLICVRRSDDSKIIWTLTGLVIRIAHSLGLHRDGTIFKLSPFDTEMRRRLWGQICILDMRASEDYGSDPTILEYSYDTQLPLNINDEDLDPQSSEFPEPRVGVSEMTFSLIRFEICHTTRRLAYLPPSEGSFKAATQVRPLAEKEEIVRSLQKRLETTYLVHCQGAGPLFWVAAMIARLIMAKMYLIIYTPHIEAGLSQETKDRLFVVSIEIVEYCKLIKTEVSTKQWGWLFHTYFQWHAIAFILGEICCRPRSPLVDRGWRAVDGTFNDWDDAVKHSKNGILWAPMRKLMARARKRREEDMRISTEFKVSGQLDNNKAPAYFNGWLAPGEFQVMSAHRDVLPMEGQGTEAYSTQSCHSGPTDQAQPAPLDVEVEGFQGVPTQQQMQYQDIEQTQSTPWILDNSALLDLDMDAIRGDLPMESWDDLVSYFHMGVDGNAGPADVRPSAHSSSWL